MFGSPVLLCVEWKKKTKTKSKNSVWGPVKLHEVNSFLTNNAICDDNNEMIQNSESRKNRTSPVELKLLLMSV